jgi:hypothetical protein
LLDRELLNVFGEVHSLAESSHSAKTAKDVENVAFICDPTTYACDVCDPSRCVNIAIPSQIVMNREQIGKRSRRKKGEDGPCNLTVPRIEKIVRFESIEQLAGLRMARQNGAQNCALHEIVVRQSFF